MKKSALIALVLFVLTGLAAPVTSSVYAQTPTKKETPARLANAKKVALQHVGMREKDLKRLVENLKRYKGKMSQADYKEVESNLEVMKKWLGEWRSDVSAAATTDQVKEKQTYHVKRTRYYRAFKPDYQLQVRSMVMKKTLAQINKRTENIESELAKKRNNAKNNNVENAAKKVAEVKATASGLEPKIAALKQKILALTPELANTDLPEFKKKMQEVRKEINDIKATLNKTVKVQKELREDVKKIKNATPTPTP